MKPPNKRFIYDLYGVSNHFGSMNGGHYTAYCMNPVVGRWYNYDDSLVTPLCNGKNTLESQSLICSKAAYVVFYKLRK